MVLARTVETWSRDAWTTAAMPCTRHDFPRGAHGDHIVHCPFREFSDNTSKPENGIQLSQGLPDRAWTQLVCMSNFPP